MNKLIIAVILIIVLYFIFYNNQENFIGHTYKNCHDRCHKHADYNCIMHPDLESHEDYHVFTNVNVGGGKTCKENNKLRDSCLDSRYNHCMRTCDY